MFATDLEIVKGSIDIQCSLFPSPVECVLIHLMHHKCGTQIAEILADQNALDSDFE